MATLRTLRNPGFCYSRRVVGTADERLAQEFAVELDVPPGARARVLCKVYSFGGGDWKEVDRARLTPKYADLRGQAFLDAMLASGAQPGRPPRDLPRMPSFAKLERWSFDGIAEAVDGCTIEPDGTCEHGSRSWLLVAGVI